jgi:hypothetical protein
MGLNRRQVIGGSGARRGAIEADARLGRLPRRPAAGPRRDRRHHGSESDVHRRRLSLFLDDRPQHPNTSSARVATEFVATSITSDPLPYDLIAGVLPENPHVKYFDTQAGAEVLRGDL